ncbi:hypothetical protein B0J13DRAFT_569479 [Dactylonectria estremocensis]|uniref:DUF7730 domain-containing protein n=1 Tax=Dactylonectria estremocensis TaxID=1079267 RepID=A0A9P9DGB8_9HYPO|nr:hypothetical protein B0J13DRAFT_569479 [Dactylonectria estremocensis]
MVLSWLHHQPYKRIPRSICKNRILRITYAIWRSNESTSHSVVQPSFSSFSFFSSCVSYVLSHPIWHPASKTNMTEHMDEHPGDSYSPLSPRYSPHSSAASPSSTASVAASVEASPEGQDENREAPVRQLPRLPNPRPRALTPPSFRDADADAESNSNQGPKAMFQESAAYFRLPPNIRRDILRLAFGDVRLHMDLSYIHPDAPHQPVAAHHCGIENKMLAGRRLRKKRVLDTTQPKAWRWWSSICHRHPPDAVGPMTRRGLVGPWDDYCRSGFAEHCLDWRDAGAPSACHIGIMGWLLSCRQNYAESINVLYSTNTFAMASELMVTNLPDLLLPQQLAVISSLEISWALITRPVTDELDHADLDEHHLQIILQLLSSKFPALRRLYLSLEEHATCFSIHAEREYMRVVEKHLGQFVKGMPALRECAFAVPEWFFDFVYDEASSEPVGDGTYQSTESYRQVWRTIDGEASIIRLPFVNSYPCAPYHLTHAASQLPGYWILEGSNAPDPQTPPTYSGVEHDNPPHAVIFF